MRLSRFHPTSLKDTGGARLTNISNSSILHSAPALGSAAEALSRAIGLQRTKQISDARFNDFNLLHYDVENRLLRLVEKLEQKRDARDWVNRISEDPSAYLDDSELHHSITPSLHPSERDA
jgi:hypothetical protein